MHPQGGEIYEDNINPTVWLQENVGDPDGDTQPVSWNPTGFILATFNVLGHSHTKPGGNRQGWASSRTRMRWAVQLFDGYGVDVVGLQEFQPIQKRTFLGAVGRPLRGVLAAARRNRQLDRLEECTLATGQRHNLQGSLLRRASHARCPSSGCATSRRGRTASSSTSTTPRAPRATPTRARTGLKRSAARSQRFEALTTTYKVPVYLTGDLNARAEAFCALTAGGLMTAAAGGSNEGECNVPRNPGIDWIFGSSLTRFSPQLVVRDGVSGRISDHPFVVARAAGASQ